MYEGISVYRLEASSKIWGNPQGTNWALRSIWLSCGRRGVVEKTTPRWSRRYARSSSARFLQGGVALTTIWTTIATSQRCHDRITCIAAFTPTPQHHEDGALAFIRGHDAASIFHRARSHRSRCAVSSLAVTHPPHMGPHFPLPPGALYSPPELARDPESGQLGETHAKTSGYCRMWPFALRSDLHLGMDDQP